MSKTESTELRKIETKAIDGFAGYTNHVEGSEQPPSVGLIRGMRIRFSADERWLDRDDNELSPDLGLIAANLERVVRKWIGDNPVETIVLAPGQKFPNLEKLNDECPRSEWREKFGKLVGPWSAEHIFHFLEPKTMAAFTWPSPITTFGSARAVSDLVERINWMRKARCSDHIFPIVTLGKTFMQTQYGGRQRPVLEVKRWILLGGDQKLLGANEPAAIGPPLQEVKAPSLAEELNDSIPDFGAEQKK
jgi:hypothetical protein